MYFNKVVLTTDLTDDSLRAFDTAAYLAKIDGAKVTILYVAETWQPPIYMMHEIPNPESITAYNKAIVEDAETRLKELCGEYFHEQSVVLKVIQTEGSVADEICEYAEANDSNVIMMSSHGRSKLGRFVLGSVASQVLSHAPCPVMVIPPKQDLAS